MAASFGRVHYAMAVSGFLFALYCGPSGVVVPMFRP